ncbi:Na/Pi cotransporter family protein [Pikeienuella piscinae]|uniref:Na/Pi cotransporter family protein n=1 Tax=Pikeienuella piscinae TaxID=2748098 RepID=A0A7L5C0Y6_9RHOB|nr:Na/Pi cotransporter family protein [Pikeienuella piscinae]QIE56778.1 Na/Pi cotransporter family protein [Pikeienuella piscinae]
MAILAFLTQLLGATMLLLYAVRMVRTGIERAFGASFRRIVTTAGGPLRAAAAGLTLAVILQSSAAVALLVAGFASVGAIGFATGLPALLGADLGSALLIQILSFKYEWLEPVLLALGGGLFLNSNRRATKQAGRILIGIAFILIALSFLRQAMEPIRESEFLPAIAGYLESDYVSAFIVGAALAFIMHSSVAAILMCVTLVAVGALPLMAGASLVLGANLGSAMLPLWLTRAMPTAARRIPAANLAIRGAGAIAAVIGVNHLPAIPYIAAVSEAQTVINVHIIFNCLLLISLPLCGFLQKPFERLMPHESEARLEVSVEQKSVLDEAALSTPQLALASLKREVLRMTQLTQTMARPVMELYDSGDKKLAAEIAAQDDFVDKALDGVRRYAAAMTHAHLKKDEEKRARELTEYAIALESAADIVVKRLVPLALKKSDKAIRFSPAGRRELVLMFESLLANLDLAANVLVSDDLESARLLLEEKNEMTQQERASRKKHLKRLGDGTSTSFESSNIHLETLSAIKDLNSQIAVVAYPILHRAGQLLETRLINNLKD